MITFKVTSRNRIPELRRQLRPRAGRVINGWAGNVLAISRQLVNVGDHAYTDSEGERHPERLKRSGRVINYANTRGDGRQAGVAKSVAYFAPYSKLVHDGWSAYAGNPFLLAAFEAERARLLAELAAVFRKN